MKENEPLPFGARLRQARDLKGLTQQGLADAIGVNRVTIARLEGSHGAPSLDTIESLAEVLGTTIEALRRAAPAPRRRKKGAA